MPSVLEAYKADFGGTDEAVLEFVFRYLEEEYDQDNILSQVKVKNILITYPGQYWPPFATGYIGHCLYTE